MLHWLRVAEEEKQKQRDTKCGIQTTKDDRNFCDGFYLLASPNTRTSTSIDQNFT